MISYRSLLYSTTVLYDMHKNFARSVHELMSQAKLLEIFYQPIRAEMIGHISLELSDARLLEARLWTLARAY